jgi:hypothetical protein
MREKNGLCPKSRHVAALSRPARERIGRHAFTSDWKLANAIHRQRRRDCAAAWPEVALRFAG